MHCLFLALCICLLQADESFSQTPSPTSSSNLFRRFLRRSVPPQINRPLTVELCRSPTFRNLRSCKVAVNPSLFAVGRSLSSEYLCQHKDRWLEGPTDQTYRRNKRYVNHCSGTKIKKVILRAYEARRPHIERELLHDPANHLYQTMFVESCYRPGPFNGYYCRMHQIKFKAAVWSLDYYSNEISVIDVLTNGYCALTEV